MQTEVRTEALESVTELAKALTHTAGHGFVLGDVELRNDAGVLLGRLVAHTMRGNYANYVAYRLVLNLKEEQDMSPKDLMVLTKDVIANN